MTRQELFAWQLVAGDRGPLGPPPPTASSGLLLLYGGSRVLDGRLSLGDLMMFLVYLAMLLEPLAVLTTSVTQLQNNLSELRPGPRPARRAREMVSNAGTLRRRQAARSPGGSASRKSPSPTRNTTTRVLRDIDLEVEPGEVVALVGRAAQVRRRSAT